MISGILNINKPSGITSHDVVKVIRKIFKGQKIGHTGTLDPLASGVLPICIGKATKLSDILTAKDKKYRVKCLLGVETDTYDITGKVVEAGIVDKDEIYIKERIKRFIGKQQQIPPIYSAIKVNGKKLYEYARENKEIEIKPRDIEIFSIDNIKYDKSSHEVSFDVHCTKGTYIRSLVHDIGIKLGTKATMTALTRLKSGNFLIEDSVDMQEFLEMQYPEMLEKVITIEEYYKENKKVVLSEEDVVHFINGMTIEVEGLDNKIVRVYQGKKFIGIGTVKENHLKRYLVEEE